MKSKKEIKEWSLTDTKEYKRFKRKLEIVQNKKMKHKKKVKKWLLKHCIDNYGDINLTDLDFSDFDGNINLDGIQVKKDLHQSFQKVGGDLWQTNQIVDGKIYNEKPKQTIKDVKEWIINNCVNSNGNIDLDGLDFSDFDGDIHLNKMKVKKNLHQCYQEISGNLYQFGQEVKGDLYQNSQQVNGELKQDKQQVKGKLLQNFQYVGGKLYQDRQFVADNLYQDRNKVMGHLYQDRQKVDGDLYQCEQEVGKELHQYKLNVKGKIIDKKIGE